MSKAPEHRSNLAFRLAAFAALAVLLALLTLMRFGPWFPQVFFGDDLSNFTAFKQGQFASSPIQALTTSYYEKFRPVFAMAAGGLFSLFGPRIELYTAVNAAINVASGLIVAAIALKLTRGRMLIAAAAAIAVATSRFLLYQVTQVTGLVEGLGLLLFLAMLLFVVDLHMEPRARAASRALVDGLLASLAIWLLVLTHERYLGAAPWLAVMLFVAPGLQRVGLPARLGLAVLAVGPVFAHLGMKMLVLKEAFLVGTGGTHMTLDWPGMLDRVQQALLSVLAFNHGPPHLAAWDVTASLVSVSGLFAILFTALLATILIAGARSQRPGPAPGATQDYFLPFALVVLAGLLLLPPVMTIRIEQRWLVQPFTLLILIAAWFAGRLSLSRPRRAAVLFIALAVSSMVVDSRISKAFPNLFFVYSERVAETVKHTIIDVRPMPTKVTIVAADEFCNWVLLRGAFFALYADPKQQETCVTSLKEIDAKTYQDGGRPKIFSVNQDYSVTDISAPAYKAIEEMAEPVRLDFLKAFDEGAINDIVRVDTPTGRGALLLDVDLGHGVAQTLTILSRFAYRYDQIAVQPGDVLKFEPAMINATKQPARARVTATQADGSVVTLYDAVLPLRPQGGPTVRALVSIPLDKLQGPVSITFAVETPGNDSSGHWVAFRRPGIVEGPKPEHAGAAP